MKIVILWYGLPYYGARVIGEARKQHPQVEFTVLATAVGVPYSGLDVVAGKSIRWIDDTKDVTWGELDIEIPDICIITSWSHFAHMQLAREARRKNNTVIVSMTDNFFHGSIKQWFGALYFRFFLRSLFDYMWVPGRRGVSFMRFLGMPSNKIITGLYAADSDLFYPPKLTLARTQVIFVGQFIVRKGIENIIAAAKSESGKKYRSQLLLIGQGSFGVELTESGIVTEGFKQAAELGDIYRQSSALLLPSFRDHWGVVAHEAALCGGLILATKQCGCVDDLVEHGVNGYIMKESSCTEVLCALDWHASLTTEQITRGRRVSIEKSLQYSPRLWAMKLNEIVTHFRN